MAKSVRSAIVAAFPYLAVVSITPLVLVLLAVTILQVLNSDFYGRTAIIKSIHEAGSSGAPNLALVIHRIFPEEHLAEATVQLSWNTASVPSALLGKEKCLGVDVADAAVANGPSRAQVVLDCKDGAVLMGHGVVSALFAESPKFTLEAWPSLAGYPFDGFEIHPLFSASDSQGEFPAITYAVEKNFPGREVSLSGSYPNRVIHFKRSKIEITFALAAGVLFVALVSLVALRLIFESHPLTGMQDLLALAGFFVAAASFWSIFGSAGPGVSAFQVFVFGLPMVLLAVGIIVQNFRALTERNRRSP